MNCIICKEEIVEESGKVVLGEKGADSVNEASRSRKREDVTAVIGDPVHKSCRSSFTNKKSIEQYLSSLSQVKQSQRRESSRLSGNFNFKSDCLFCSTPVTFDRTKKKEDSFKVRTRDFENTLREVCGKRNDDWSGAVMTRILAATADLHAADVVYHKSCYSNFLTERNIPNKYSRIPLQSGKRKSGRPQNLNQNEAFEKVVEFFQANDDEQLTLNDLVSMMNELMGDSQDSGYSERYMKKKMRERFGESAVFAEINGRQNVITLRATAHAILHEYYLKPKNVDVELEKEAIVRAAAAIIKSDAKGIKQQMDVYPNSENLGEITDNLEYLPSSLRLFLNTLFVGDKTDRKVASIGQCMLQACRPKAIRPPLQIGLAVQLHHQFGSRFLIDMLSAMGFSSSYYETKLFERNAVVSNSINIEGLEGTFCMQHIADNVDHNVRTLDGNGTFHGMGIIVSVTPLLRSSTVLERRKFVTSRQITEPNRIPIKYLRQTLGQPNLLYDPLPRASILDPSKYCDLLWKTSRLFPAPLSS